MLSDSDSVIAVLDFPSFRELYGQLESKTDEAGEDVFGYDYETESAGSECGGECADAH